MKSNWNYPTTIWVGKNRVKDLSIACKNLNIKKPLLVTDTGLAKSNIIIDVLKNLKEMLMEYFRKEKVRAKVENFYRRTTT